MKKILELLQIEFQSSSGKTPQFIAFAKAFKLALKKELENIDAKMTVYNVGHFYVSGFFLLNEQCYYFSLSDVRGMHYENSPQMLFRTAKDEKDFTGGSNQYVKIGEGMAEAMRIS